MVDNLDEKANECPPNRVVSACIQLGLQKLSVIQSSGCPVFRGCLSIEVNGRTVGTFGLVHYIRC